MKTTLLRIAFVAIVLYSTVFAVGAERDAIVKIICRKGRTTISGSGVCVRKDGVILTATHVVDGGVCEVIFRDAKYPVIQSMILPKEGVAVLKIQANKPLPALSIATNKPKVGETVWIMGYPQGKWTSLKTSVTSNGIWFRDDKDTHLTGVFDPAIFGNSGGPLVTADWKVAGIASVSGKIPAHMLTGRESDGFHVGGTGLEITGGMYLSLQHVKEAYERFTAQRRGPPQNSKPVLYAFSLPGCPDCDVFKRDYRSGRYSDYDVQIVEHGTNQWATVSRTAMRTTGTQHPDTVPFFWVEGSARFVQQQGQYSAPGLLQILRTIVQGLGNLIFNPSAEPQAPPSESASTELGFDELGLSEPPPFEPAPMPKELTEQSPEEPDWSDVEVVILGAKQEVSPIRGLIRNVGLKFLTGPLERKLNELSKGKLGVHIVGQRVSPNQYEAVAMASRVSPSPFHVLILIGRQSLGLKSLIAKPIEKRIRNTLGEKVPVEAIFARAHSKDYQAIKQALLTAETERYSRGTADTDEQQDGDTSGLDTKQLAGEVAALLLPKIEEKLPGPIQDAVKLLIPKKEEDGSEPLQQGIVALLLGLVGERVTRHFQKRKKAKAA